MSADPQMIQQQPKGAFATYVRGLTERAVPMSFPFFILEKMPKATKEEIDAIRQQCRHAYAEPWSPRVSNEAPVEKPEPEPEEKSDTEDPVDPSPEI